MKKILFLFLFLSTFSAGAQNLKDFYIQSMHDEGQLYFIRPQKMPEKTMKKKMTAKPLSYDYTYLDSRDSVSLLMTVVTKEMFNADSLDIISNGKVVEQSPIELIFCKSGKKNTWEYRLRAHLTYTNWIEIYKGASPFCLKLSSAEQPNDIWYSDKDSKWKKTSACYQRLHEIIRMNRK